MKQIEKYQHHGTEVSVFSDLKGKHRENCLCHAGCTHFKPETPENCEIAQSVFENCVLFSIVTPLIECPKFHVRRFV